MKKYSYRKLKGRIVERFGTQAAFAEVLGLSKNSMCKKLKGKSGFKQSEIEQWAALLGIDRAEFGAYFFS